MKTMDRLDKAIAEFEDEASEVPFSERFSNLRKALMWNAFETIKKVKKNGLKDPVSDEDLYIQDQCSKQFRIMEKAYESELKMARNTGKKPEDVDAAYLQKIIKMKSTIGDIVRETK